MRNIDHIIVHCSDSEWGNAEVIDGWHKDRGWKGIGYHYVIPNGRVAAKSKYSANWDGILETGRPLQEQGAHARRYNRRSIGICLIGKGTGLFTPRQIDTLRHLLQTLQTAYRVPASGVIGHRDVNKTGKICPGFDVRGWL